MIGGTYSGGVTLSNSTANTLITGTGNDDSIVNTADNVTVYGGDGNDTIQSGIYDVGGSNPYIDGGEGNDYIENVGAIGTLIGGKGDDTIDVNQGVSNVLYANGDGNDLIIGGFNQFDHRLVLVDDSLGGWSVDGSDLIICVGDGSLRFQDGRGMLLRYLDKDGEEHRQYFGPRSIANDEPSTLLNGSEYDDTIYSTTGDDVSINAGAGNDYINNKGAYASINGGAGNDIVENYGEDVLIDGGADNDNISNGEGGDNATLLGGKGNDYIANWNGFNVLINGGVGNDSINVADGTATIEYALGDGNDTVLKHYSGCNYDGMNNVVHLTSGTLGDFGLSFNDVIVTIGSGSIRFLDARGQLIRFVDADGSHVLRAFGNSTIENTLDGILLETSRYVDKITNSGENVTIKSGAGADTLTGSDFGEVYIFGSKDGRNVITNFGENDSIVLEDASITSTLRADDDYIVNIGSTAITLQGAGDLNFRQSNGVLTISDETAPADDIALSTINSNASIRVVGTSGNDSIVNNGDKVTIASGAGNDTLTGSKYGELYQFAYTDGDNLITNFGKNDSIQLVGGSIKSGSVVGNDYVITLAGVGATGTVTLKGAGKYVFNKTATLLTAEEDGITVRASKNGAKLTGNSGADILINSIYENVTMQGNGGNDTLIGSDAYGETFLFKSTDGNNLITNFGQNDTVKITSGDLKTVTASGDNAVVTFKDSDNRITLGGAARYDFKPNGNIITVDAINYVSVSGDGDKITGSTGRDHITNPGFERVTIQSGKGNDTIVGSADDGELILFAYNSGNNVVTNFGKGDTLKSTNGTLTYEKSDDGNDIIVSITKSKNVSKTILQGAANLHLIQEGNVLTVDDATYFEVIKDGQKITGTSGKDYIVNPGYSKVTIQPGKGNDTIESSEDAAEFFAFAYTGGNNVITDFGANDTLKATSGTLSTVVSGNDVIVNITKSKTTSTVTLQGAAGQRFSLNGAFLTVDKTNYIDATIDGQKVTGSSGADFITNPGFERVTIQPGKGNDTIEGSDDNGDMFLFAYNGGANVITNFGKGDTLKSTNGTLTYEKSGDDVIVSIAKSGTTSKTTLQGAGELELKQSGNVLTVNTINRIENNDDGEKVTGTGGKDYITNTAQYVSIDGNEGDDTIDGSDFGEVILFDAIDGNDVVLGFDTLDVLQIMSGTIQSASVSSKDYVVTVQKDSTIGTVTLRNVDGTKMRRKGDAFILDGGANNIANSRDTINLAGSDFNDSIQNYGNKVTINGGAGNDTIDGCSYGEVFMFAADGGQDLIKNFGKNDTLRIPFGAIQSTLRAGDDVIVNVKSALYAGSVTLGGAGGYSFDGGSDANGEYLTVKNVTYKVNRADDQKFGGTSKAEFMTNSGANVTIVPGKGNDTIEGSNFAELYTFAYTHGNNVITNFGINDSLKMTSGKSMTYKKNGNDVIVSLTSGKTTGTVTLQNTAGYSFETVSGNVLRVKNINVIENADEGEKITGTGGADYIINTGEKVTIQPGKGNDTIEGSDEYGDMFLFAYTGGNNVITNFGKNDTIKSTSGTLTYKTSDDDAIVSITKSGKTATVTLEGAGDYVFNNKSNVLTVLSVNEIDNDFDNLKVVGSTGRDFITNSGEGVSIQSGKGNDTIEGSIFGETFLFAQTDGANVITNFGVNDTLKATSGTISTQKSGSDLVVSITKSSKKATVTLEGAGGYTFAQEGNALYVDGVKEIVNAEDKQKITGSSGKDYIVNTGEKVTITGSKGADTITGSDEFGELFNFAYTHGANVITNFGVNDTLKATSGTLTYKQSNNNYVVTIASGTKKATVTLLDAAENYTLQQSKDGKSIIARAKASIFELNELPPTSEDYWFEQDSADDELGEILSTDAPIDLNFDDVSETFKPKLEIAISARHRKD